MKKNTILISLVVLLTLVVFVLVINNTIKLNNSKWSCIANECSEFSTGNEWVKQNCNVEDKEMICKFQYEGQNFRVPLSKIENVSDMISCKTYKCSSWVLISTDKSGGK